MRRLLIAMAVVGLFAVGGSTAKADHFVQPQIQTVAHRTYGYGYRGYGVPRRSFRGPGIYNRAPYYGPRYRAYPPVYHRGPVYPGFYPYGRGGMSLYFGF